MHTSPIDHQKARGQRVLLGPPGLFFGLSLLIFLFARLVFGMEVRVVTQEGSAPDGEVRLTMHHIESIVHNQVIATRHAFQVYNGATQEVEAGITLSLNPGETIDGFSYWNGDEQIVGEVLEKQVAQQVYQELTGVARDPGLLELTRHRFTFRVFPIAPGETKPIEVRTVTPLSVQRGVVQIPIPPDNLPPPAAVFSLKVDISDNLPLGKIACDGISCTTSRQGPHRAKVVYEGSTEGIEKGIAIRYALDAKDYAMRLTTHRRGEADGSFMLVVTPKEQSTRADVIGRDIVFVIDRSGSMQGEPLNQTRRALTHVLSRLNRDDRFNIISFDDEARSLFKRLAPVTEQTLEQAEQAVAALESGGGTNIRDALGLALEELKQKRGDRPRAIIFLTDGQGNNPPGVVLSHVRQAGANVRLYSFGAGNGVNRPFLERLARDNRGIATFIDRADQIETEVTALYNRIAMPLMVDLELDFGDLDFYNVYPKKLPDLYQDSQVIVFGRYSRPGKGTIRVTGKLKGRRRSLTLPVDLPESAPDHQHIEKLWAQQRIAHQMDIIRTRGEHNEEMVKEVTKLGIVYNLATEYTAFIAVPESLQTGTVKEMLRQGKRGYDKRLIDSMDQVRLSMRHIPPGDPVLSVAAPKEAQRVVAYFPFGLIKRLAYDSLRGHWSVRFLVPRTVLDGVYRIRIQITHADGRIEWQEEEYTIDGTAPEFTAIVPETAPVGQSFTISVDPLEPVRGVSAYLNGDRRTPIPLFFHPETGCYTGTLPSPRTTPASGEFTLHLVVRDLAHNLFERDFVIRAVEADDLPDAQRRLP